MRRALAIFLLLPVAAAAQVYIWKDADGRPHYSDRPPADRSIERRRLGPEFTSEEETSAARKAAADKRLEAAKRGKEAQEAAAKAEKERAEDEERRKNCDRARAALQGLESGQMRFRITASGEREALDGSAREAELAETRRSVESNCAARPATPAAPTAAKKPAPAY